ncbi:MAG: class I SAM-dependent methyltransferase [Ktedonobacterales bacterium]|nr:class I SAM-dependent methyltransferase [Ktedonobacterales bacterium]
MQPQENTTPQELQRITREYAQRDVLGKSPSGRYSFFNEATLLHVHSLERNMLALLKHRAMTSFSLADRKILDVGCGRGHHLRRFLDYGAHPENLTGIDLLPERIQAACALNPAIRWDLGSAHELPYPDGSFDLVMSFLVFSSILDAHVRQQVADEMWRVLAPGGVILCHDFGFNNPRNSAVSGFPARKMRTLFLRPGAQFEARRIVLAPPISRRLAPRSWWLANTLERLRFLNTHVIAVVSQRPGAPSRETLAAERVPGDE